jgi:RAD50-interacting protein 1
MDTLLVETKKNVETDLHTAQNLSLLRHSLADELAELSISLVSTFSDAETQESTLLEDLEAIHRNLKELHGVKSYVQVIEHALKLRHVATILPRFLLLRLIYQ